jgi:diguanylate cyclase (GGDEF)-like protein
VNDRFGHDQGDLVLKSIASILASSKRESDILARIGGEEFAMLLPETTTEAACAFAERMCEMIRSFPLIIAGEEINITISVGVAQATIRTSGIEALCRNADQALYEAKRSGRDCVMVFSPSVEKMASAAE